MYIRDIKYNSFTEREYHWADADKHLCEEGRVLP